MSCICFVAVVSNMWMPANDYRHPFPPHWHVPSFDNYTSVELTSGTEFEQVQREFHASVPRGTMELLSVTRYVPVRPACVPRCLTVLTCSCTSWSRVQNRYQWQRHKQRRDRMLAITRDEALLCEELLWHGTSNANPDVICMGQAGVDFRLVRWL